MFLLKENTKAQQALRYHEIIEPHIISHFDRKLWLLFNMITGGLMQTKTIPDNPVLKLTMLKLIF